ncbi:hypothetical protein [Flagellimonas onchidii]|nr:hypothetical protein [Allomuricauda onchidii]
MNKFSTIIGVFLAIFVISCEGPEGPPGFDGDPGAPGADGI